MTDTDFHTCQDCRTRVREGQMHSVETRVGVKSHVLFTVVRAGRQEDDWGRAIIYSPKTSKAPRAGRRVTKPLVFVDGGEDTMDHWVEEGTKSPKAKEEAPVKVNDWADYLAKVDVNDGRTPRERLAEVFA